MNVSMESCSAPSTSRKRSSNDDSSDNNCDTNSSSTKDLKIKFRQPVYNVSYDCFDSGSLSDNEAVEADDCSKSDDLEHEQEITSSIDDSLASSSGEARIKSFIQLSELTKKTSRYQHKSHLPKKLSNNEKNSNQPKSYSPKELFDDKKEINEKPHLPENSSNSENNSNQHKPNLPNESVKDKKKINEETHVPVSDVNTHMFTSSGIEMGDQIWNGWSNSCICEDLTFRRLGLTVVPSEIALRTTARLLSSHFNIYPESYNSQTHSVNSDNDAFSIYGKDANGNLYAEPNSNLRNENNIFSSQVPQSFENEIMAASQFGAQFKKKYGDKHPDFYNGTLNEAFVEAFSKPGKKRKLLAVYLHHNTSVFTNIFCSQLLCTELVIQYLRENFILWGADVTLENHKSFICSKIHNVLCAEAAKTAKNTKVDKFPLILIINKIEQKTELLSVMNGILDLDELLTRLIETVDIRDQGLEQRSPSSSNKEAGDQLNEQKVEQ